MGRLAGRRARGSMSAGRQEEAHIDSGPNIAAGGRNQLLPGAGPTQRRSLAGGEFLLFDLTGSPEPAGEAMLGYIPALIATIHQCRTLRLLGQPRRTPTRPRQDSRAR